MPPAQGLLKPAPMPRPATRRADDGGCPHPSRGSFPAGRTDRALPDQHSRHWTGFLLQCRPGDRLGIHNNDRLRDGGDAARHGDRAVLDIGPRADDYYASAAPGDTRSRHCEPRGRRTTCGASCPAGPRSQLARGASGKLAGRRMQRACIDIATCPARALSSMPTGPRGEQVH